MNIAVYSTAFTAFLIGLIALSVIFRHLRTLRAAELARAAQLIDVARYQPMQRLLSSRDLALVAGDKELTKLLRTQRYNAFRDYLRCLTKDFGALLGGVRLVMVQSSVDRPELAALLYRSEWNFMLSLFKIEARLLLYRAGMGNPDLSALVNQLQTLAKIEAPTLRHEHLAA